MEIIVSIILSILLLIYGVCCLIFDGSFVNYIGWRSRELFPVSYWISIITSFGISSVIIANLIINPDNLKKKKNKKEK